MPTFKSAKPQGIAQSIAALMGSSSDLQGMDIINAAMARSKIGEQDSLAEKARQEVVQMQAKAAAEQAAAVQRRDPTMQRQQAAYAAGIRLPDARQLQQNFQGDLGPGQMPAIDAQGVAGPEVPGAPIQAPANVSPNQSRIFNATMASLLGNMAATGPTNPDQIAKAGTEYQGQGITGAVQDAIARGDTTGASAMNQGGKLGQPIKLADAIGSTGAVLNPASGAVATDNPLAQATITETNAKGKVNDESAKLRSILTAAGIDPASQQGQQLFRALAVKTATHQPATSVSVNTRQETEEAKAVGKALGESFNDIQKSGADAGSKINRYDRIGSLLSGVDTGKLTPMGTELAAWADSAGIKIDKNIGNKQAAKALANEIALQLRNPSGGAGMPGAMSDKDREFLVSMTPNLGTTPEGNKLLIETAKKLARRDQEVAKLARDYRAKNGSMGPGFYDELQQFSDSNPLFSPKSGGGGQAPGAPTVGTVMDGHKFKGGNPADPKNWVKVP